MVKKTRDSKSLVAETLDRGHTFDSRQQDCLSINFIIVLSLFLSSTHYNILAVLGICLNLYLVLATGCFHLEAPYLNAKRTAKYRVNILYTIHLENPEAPYQMPHKLLSITRQTKCTLHNHV
jgi:hypothetical protein